MKHKLTLLFVLSILILLPTTGYAQDNPPGPEHTAPFWQATYWNNQTLSGAPALERQEASLNYDWGTGSPASGIMADHFSARWTRFIDLPAGEYRFVATSDDGFRVYVDDQLIIDQWWDHPALTSTAQISLSGGHHELEVEYYENGGFAVAQLYWEPVQVNHGRWQGTYFNNANLSGAPAFTRNEARVNFDWGYGSPGYGVSNDYFSARWTTTILVGASDNYRFTTHSDDGVRVYVDGRRIIDDWSEHPLRASRGDIYLTQGEHNVAVEYFERAGLAAINLSWEVATNPIQNWQGEYFTNRSLSGSPALVRDDTAVNFNWGFGSPASTIPADNFSARWTRTLNLTPGSYRFATRTDDGVRLWVNGHLLIDHWRDQAVATYQDVIYVNGQAEVVMEYYEHGGLAEARMTWERIDGPPDPPPTPQGVIIDDTDDSFVQGGSSSGWRTENEGYNGRLTWTRTNDYARAGYNWSRWYPDLAAGTYEVFVYVPDRYTTTSSARYWVSHQDGYTLRQIDQSRHGGEWVSLGAFRFRGTRSDYVSLADVTFEPYQSRIIAFDAVRWVPR